MTLKAEFTFYDQNSFVTPNFIVHSAWLEHGPFAMWVVSRLKPSIFVELGTHNGYSYFCFAQSIAQSNIESKMYAIDTWKGDEHAGFYGNEVYSEVAEINLRNYSRNSYLLRETFDEGLKHFSEDTIDLLHIDGLHTYEAVMHDFKSWLPKLSDKGIVIFHDISVRERGFGVFKLWEELSQQYPSFEFIHGNGLGVLKVGKLPTAIDDLFSADEELKSNIQKFYASLGSKITLKFEIINLRLHYESVLARANTDLGSTKALCENLQVNIINRDNSMSWKITYPVRFLHEIIRHILKKFSF